MLLPTHYFHRQLMDLKNNNSKCPKSFFEADSLVNVNLCLKLARWSKYCWWCQPPALKVNDHLVLYNMLRYIYVQQCPNNGSIIWCSCIFTRVKLMPLISWTLPVTSFVDMSTESMFLVPRLSQVFNLMLLKLFLLLLSLFMYNSLLFQKWQLHEFHAV